MILGTFGKQPTKINAFNKGDISAVIVYLVITLILLLPFVVATSAHKIIIASTGGDTANHFMMFNYSLANGSPPYFNNDAKMLDILRGYPQSLHMSMAMVFNFIFQSDSLLQKIIFYYLISIFYFGAMAFFFTQVVTIVSSKSIVACVTIGLSIWPVVGVYLLNWGFLTQIAGFAYMFALLYVLVDKDKEKHILIHTSLVSLLLIGISSTYYILLVPAVIGITSQSRMYMVYARRIKWIIILAIPAILAAPVLNLLSSNKDLISLLPEKYAERSDTFLLPGSVYMYGDAIIIFMISALVALVIGQISLRLHQREFPSPILWSAFTSYAMVVLIGVYQLVSVGELRYYVYKLSFLTMSFALLTCAWLMKFLIEDSNKKSKLLLFIAIALPCIFALRNQLSSAPIDSQLKVNVGSYFAKNILLNENDENTIFASECNPTSAQIANNWLNAIYLNNTLLRRKLTKDAIEDIDNTRFRSDIIYDDC